jgi:hypothetical protein
MRREEPKGRPPCGHTLRPCAKWRNGTAHKACSPSRLSIGTKLIQTHPHSSIVVRRPAALVRPAPAGRARRNALLVAIESDGALAPRRTLLALVIAVAQLLLRRRVRVRRLGCRERDRRRTCLLRGRLLPFAVQIERLQRYSVLVQSGRHRADIDLVVCCTARGEEAVALGDLGTPARTRLVLEVVVKPVHDIAAAL